MAAHPEPARRRTVPRDEWGRFFEQFAEQHRGWQFRLAEARSEQLGADPAELERHARTVAELVPLSGIRVSEEGGRAAVTVIAGEGQGEPRHELRDVAQVDFEETIEKGHRGLDLYTADGEVLVLRFRSAPPPETVDGLAESEQARPGESAFPCFGL